MSSVLDSPNIETSPLSALWAWLRSVFPMVHVQRRERRLRLCESLPLGEKRSVAVVEFEEQRFLLAVTSANISLLQPLGPAQPGQARFPERS
jgi:flagellar biogenesis protein FliO